MNIQRKAPANSISGDRRIRCLGAMVPLAVLLFVTQGCATQATFDSADKAVEALVAAARANDTAQMKNVLGPDSEQILFSGDPVADRNLIETFLRSYDEKHRLISDDGGAMRLAVGTKDWPLPIPIIQESGKWRFDTEAGKEEILNRRIGRNELSAIQACLAILDAQREYVSVDRNANGLREYAARFISEPGKKNGLYWPTREGEPPSPLGALAAEAAEEGYMASQSAAPSSRAFHGYRFHILTSQGANAAGGAMDYMVSGKLIGGFAIVAWPAEYGNSGIMTFIMSHEGKLYQRDLGDDTAKVALSMKSYDPGPQWKAVEEQQGLEATPKARSIPAK